MLRCPKCSRIYQTGAQRFCTHDGGRLISVAETNRSREHAADASNFDAPQAQSVSEFQPRKQTGRLVFPSNLEPVDANFGAAKFKTHESSAFKPESINGFESTAAVAPSVLERRPTGRLVLPTEIPDSFAPTGDRSINPTGRLPISAQTTSVLIGQNVKGRYAVDKVLQQDALTVTYLGHDRLGEYRQVLIKIWLDRFPPEVEETKRFYEERGALSHLNHPNIARILDAGDLTEGKPFIITEFPEGLTLREAMQISGQFSAYRTARIVRQIAQALTEAHNNRLTHRHLKPENIALKNDGKTEQVKVLNFGVAGDEEPDAESLVYQSPEVLMGQLPHIENDIFALGVVAYEMLTGRKPFSGANQDELLDAEEFGLSVKPTNLRLDLESSVDAVLERALAFSRADRFHHAREFGESLYAALTENTVFQTPVAKSEKSLVTAPTKAITTETADAIKAESPQTNVMEAKAEASVANKIESPKPLAVEAKTIQTKEKTAPNKTPWLLAAALLAVAVVALPLAYFYNKNRLKTQTATTPAAVAIQTPQPSIEQMPTSVPIQTAPIANEPTRDTAPTTPTLPPNFVRFENSQANLDGKLAENFVPFSLAFPQTWQRSGNDAKPGTANFLDVSSRAANNFPLEQLLVSWYQSSGSFAADEKAFPALVKKITAVYAKEIPAFRKIREGETTLNGQTVYEVKFAGKTKDEENKTINIFGRTLFVPAENDAAKSGLTLTMLATDLKTEISSADDIGEKGELNDVLKTFQINSAKSSPNQ